MALVEVVGEEVKDENNFGRKEVGQNSQVFGFGDDSKD